MPAVGLPLSDSIWGPGADRPEPKPPRHRPCRCCKHPTGLEPGRGAKLGGQSPDGSAKQAAVKHHRQAPGGDLPSDSPRGVAVSGGCGPVLRPS